MEEKRNLYSVLLKRQEDFKVPELAGVIAKFRKVPMHDVIGAVKSSWGILQENMQDGEAKEFAVFLEGAGFASVAVPSGLVEELPPSSLARQLKLESAGLGILCEPERWERFGWDQIALIATAGFKQITTKTVGGPSAADLTQKMIKMGVMMVTGLPIPIGPKKQESPKTIETADLVFYMDIILKGPDRRFRIDAQNFDYSCLGARMEYNALANFKKINGEIAHKSPGAIRNQGSRVLLEGRPIREMGYVSLADLDRESRWLTTLRTLKLA